MSLLLHISDAHFGTEQAPVVDALLKLAHARKPDVVVFSGDVTQRARADQFAAARRFCDALPKVPLLALPGNHDLPLFNIAARLAQPYAGYSRCFGEELEPVVEHGGFLLVGVNTTRPWRHKNGEISQEQIDRASQRLATARAGQLRVVVTHQPVAVQREEDAHDRLRGAEPALQAWSRAGCDLVLGGHIHLPYVMDLQARQPATPRRMWCVQAGTAVSSRVRHGTENSVNLIEWLPAMPGAPRGCTVERWDFSWIGSEFARASVRELLLAG